MLGHGEREGQLIQVHVYFISVLAESLLDQMDSLAEPCLLQSVDWSTVVSLDF